MGGVDYVPVPVVPELLRAKVQGVRRALSQDARSSRSSIRSWSVASADRTAEVEASAERLRESERSRSIALAAGQMGSWDWNLATGECICDAGQLRIFGVEPSQAPRSIDDIRKLIPPDDFARVEKLITEPDGAQTFQTEIRVIRPNEETRHCACTAAITTDAQGRPVFLSIVMLDVTDRKQAEAHQMLLAREVDHRARNALAVVQAIVRLTHANSQEGYVAAVEGRIHALAQAHTLLSETRWQGAHIERLVSEEMAPYRGAGASRVVIGGPPVFLSARESSKSRSRTSRIGDKFGQIRCAVSGQRGSQGELAK